MESIHSVTTQDSDCVISKHELRPLYETLIVSHPTHFSKPVSSFDAWYAQFDSWNRGIIYASQLKKYLIGFNYTKWGEISKLIPGLEMDKVNKESLKLKDVLDHGPEASTNISGA